MTDNLGATIRTARVHTIGDLLRRSAQREPNKTALICGAVAWTFSSPVSASSSETSSATGLASLSSSSAAEALWTARDNDAA